MNHQSEMDFPLRVRNFLIFFYVASGSLHFGVYFHFIDNQITKIYFYDRGKQLFFIVIKYPVRQTLSWGWLIKCFARTVGLK